MKKISLLAFFAALVMTANATDLWTGTKHVSWGDGGLQIAASEFAAAQAGQKIVVHFTGATDGIEFKVMNANFDHLAGSREAAWISGDGSFEQFLTPAAVDSLKAHGLEIIGANFNVSKVELLDAKELKDGITVWTGFFWADTWSTLELYAEGYSYVDFSEVAAIRFYTEAAGTGYVINFLEAWGDGGKIADQTAMTDGVGYKELQLTDGLRTRLAAASHWMIQFNKEALSAFNATDIVLLPKTAEITISAAGYATYYNETRAYTMPANVEGYVFNTTNGLVKEYEAGDVVPAGTALILNGAAGNYTLSFTTGGTAPVAPNQLLGTDKETALAADPDAYFYGLSLDGTGANIGLYWMNATGAAFTNGAHKAYLKLAKSSAPARFYVFEGENGATDIRATQANDEAKKFIENGRLLIRRDGITYDALGRVVR